MGLTTIILLCTIPAIKYRLRCHYHSHPPDSVPLPPSPNHPLNVSHTSQYQAERKQKDSIIRPPTSSQRLNLSHTNLKIPITPSLCSSPSALPFLLFLLFFALCPITSHSIQAPKHLLSFLPSLPQNTRLHSPKPHLRSLLTPPPPSFLSLFFRQAPPRHIKPFLSSSFLPLFSSLSPLLSGRLFYPRKAPHPLLQSSPSRKPTSRNAHISLPHTIAVSSAPSPLSGPRSFARCASGGGGERYCVDAEGDSYLWGGKGAQEGAGRGKGGEGVGMTCSYA